MKWVLVTVFVLANFMQTPRNLAQASYYREEKDMWDSFILAHTLDPEAYINENYMQWTTYDWENWLCKKDSMHYYYKGESLSGKSLNTIIVANSYQIEKAFAGPLIHYGYRGSGMAWSNRPFQTFIVAREGRRMTVFECGDLYVAAKMKWGVPMYIETSSVAPYYYPNEGNNYYNYNRYCYKIPDY